MIVTRVEAVTKTKYKVYVDGQFAFILYKGELSRFHIAEDQELSQESYEKIRTEVILKRAKLRAMHLLNDMWRTEAQLREKLTRNFCNKLWILYRKGACNLLWKLYFL